MKKILFLGLILTLSGFVHAKEYVIDDYSFTWTVASHGEASLLIQKESDKLRVILHKKIGISLESIYLLPTEAKEIGPILAKATEFYKKQKETSSDVSEDETVGDYVVTFRTSLKYGFSVSIRKSKGFSMGHFSLDRKEAVEISNQLTDIMDKVEFLDKSISF